MRSEPRRDSAGIQPRLIAARDHGRALVEPGNIGLCPRITVEPMLRNAAGRPPAEYKFFMFDGRAALIAIRKNDDHFEHSDLFVTPDWKSMPVKFNRTRFEGEFPPRPPFFDRMVSLAGCLAAGFDHIRVDFISDDDRLFAGEVSLYPHSGMLPVEPDFYDLWLGEQWTLENPGRRALMSLLGRKCVAMPRPQRLLPG